MSLNDAIRATEILLALAFLQSSTEHLSRLDRESLIFVARIGFCILLLLGVLTDFALWGLIGISVVVLHKYQGPYNGGSDRMGALILWCLALTHVMPSLIWQERVFGYLAVQLTLSYFIAGKVKITNPDWRNGHALQDVFAFSAYPVSENLRRLAGFPNILWIASWFVILFELFFPLALFSQPSLMIVLTCAAAFHLVNALIFGLNRFFWIWIAAYPSIIWLQARLF